MDLDTFVARPLVGSLGVGDFLIVAGAVALLFVITFIFGRKEKDTEDYFVGRRRVPAVVACLAFVATEVSAVTIIGVPADTFQNKWAYLQFFIGSAAARILIAFLFIPIFYRLACTTIFQFLKHRFGDETRYAGSTFFFVTRLTGSGVRLYATSLAVAVILGWGAAGLWKAVLLFTVVSILFIGFGGIKALVWTGAFETVLFFVAGIAVAAYLLLHIDGGAPAAIRAAAAVHKTDVFNWRWSLADANTIWAATLAALFLNMSVFGTDQDFMQRLLTVKTRRSSQKALIGTIAAALPLVCLYAVLGTLLFVFYGQHPEHGLPKDHDEILSHCVVNWLPLGLRGLVLATIILASIDSPLSSLSASFVTDIYRPLIRRSGTERHYLWVGRAAVVAFGLVLAALAYAFKALSGVGVLWVAFQVLAVTGGSTLGVFLLGILTKRRANRANVLAMTVSAVAMATLLYFIHGAVAWTPVVRLFAGWHPWPVPATFALHLRLGWTWLIVLGTVMTFVIGYVLGPWMERRRPPPPDEPVAG